MYSIERMRIIKKYLTDHNKVQVNTLSELLGVSEVTVRRDLMKLESKGLLTRTHGGAIINKQETPDPLIESLLLPEDNENHNSIADIALRMIKNGDVVMLTNGSVNIRLAVKLKNRKNLTVLTNDVAISLRISLQESNRVVLLGGDMDKMEKALFGSITLTNLQNFYVNHLFLEVDGINEDLYLSVNSQGKADLITGAIKVANKTIIICPSERFSKNAFYRLGKIDISQGIITNTDIGNSYKSQIFSADIPLYTTTEAFEGSK